MAAAVLGVFLQEQEISSGGQRREKEGGSGRTEDEG
jgi:hypothetical protein